MGLVGLVKYYDVHQKKTVMEAMKSVTSPFLRLFISVVVRHRLRGELTTETNSKRLWIGSAKKDTNVSRKNMR